MMKYISVLKINNRSKILFHLISFIFLFTVEKNFAAEKKNTFDPSESVNSQFTDSRLAAVIFTGITIADKDTLLNTYENYLGEPITKNNKNEIIKNIFKLYKEEGYFKPKITINAITSNKKILLVEVNEPKKGSIKIDADNRSLKKKVKKIADNSPYSSPLRKQDLARLKEALETLKDSYSEITLVTNDNNAYIYDFYIKAKQGVSGKIEINSKGSNFLGRERWSASINIDNIYKSPLSVYVNLDGTLLNDDYTSNNINFAWSFNPKLKVLLRKAKSDINKSLDIDDLLNTNRDTWELKSVFFHRFNNDAKIKLTLKAQKMDYLRIRNDEIYSEKLRSLSLNSFLQWRNNKKFSVLLINLHQGFNDFGAESVQDGENVDDFALNYHSFSAKYFLWYPLPKQFLARFILSSQYSDDILPSSKVFVSGGNSLTEAYEAGEISGDKGIGSQIELRRTYRINKHRVKPYIYYGIAETKSNEKGKEDESGASAGTGIRWQYKKLKAEVEIDRPLTNASSYRKRDPRVNGALSWKF